MKNGCCVFPFFFDANDDGEVSFRDNLFVNKLDLCRLRSTTLALRLLREVGAVLMLIKKDDSRKAGMVSFWSIFEHEHTIYFKFNYEKVGLLSTRGMRISYSCTWCKFKFKSKTLNRIARLLDFIIFRAEPEHNIASNSD